MAADAQDAIGIPIHAVGNRETGPVAKVFPQEGDNQPLFFIEDPYMVVGEIGITYLLFPLVSETCFLDVVAGTWVAFPSQLSDEFCEQHLLAAVPVGDVLVFPQGTDIVQSKFPADGPAQFGGGETCV